MIATLTYNLPDDQADFRLANSAFDLAMALWDIGQYLREVEKYDKKDTISDIRERFYSILNEYSIDLDKLIE